MWPTAYPRELIAVGVEARPRELPIGSARLHYLSLDLTRPRAVHDLLWGPALALGVDVIVHTALHRAAHDGGAHMHALNVEVTRELVRQAEQHPTVRGFIFRSHAEIYRIDHREPNLLDEDAAFDLHPLAPQRVRDRIEADLLVSLRVGTSPLRIVVLRCAEVLVPDSGSQLWDYLSSRVCLRPLGFDPMLNLLSVEDLGCAVRAALALHARGIFNIPGADTLPLSRVVALSGRTGVPVPGPLLAPLYRLRTLTIGREFRYDLNARRFHLGALLDGRRARSVLGYEPQHRLKWADPHGQADREAAATTSS